MNAIASTANAHRFCHTGSAFALLIIDEDCGRRAALARLDDAGELAQMYSPDDLVRLPDRTLWPAHCVVETAMSHRVERWPFHFLVAGQAFVAGHGAEVSP